jgi:L-ascorbate metabolism protein UlaG (beta-lactamase superfamily)
MLSETHYDPVTARFFNPEPTNRLPPADGQKRRSFFYTMLRARVRRDPSLWSRWPDHVENTPYPPPAGERTITFIGHSSFLIRLPGLTLLTDPIFSARCSPVQFAGPRRVRDPGIALEHLPPIDLVLLSHNHYDHMDLPSLRKIYRRNPNLAIIAPLGNAAYLRRKGLPATAELDWWDFFAFKTATITATPARHFAARWLNDRNRTLWAGFVIEHGGQKLYFAGDTGYTKFFTEIRTRLGAPDLALLPIGAYEPRWFMGPVHMNPADAVQAFQDLAAKRAIGMHFGTFQLTAEPIDAPPLELAAAAANLPEGSFATLDVGESAAI